ncbi:porin [Burkholderia sp. Ac-20365]|uniref:porin n=1 Tax=Burkholderia sp. Ac-20365 TaxID=2703897 RepID=UPI00197B76F8|nr:porin [Burkholderia sp. Ac-20365]MBN3763493.1 porin [Burkholderia sp. Ac-20365]
MKIKPVVRQLLVSGAGLITIPAFAQSSVTLYGIVDTGIGYQSSSTTLGSTTGGHSAFKMITGVWAGSRFGLRGSEDLGGGTKAIFTLEEGYNANNGTMSTSNVMFSRQAFVGIANTTYGSLTAGRQYASYYQLLSAYSPTTWLTGFFGAHPGDLDGMDTIYRANNTLLYTSPTLYGFKFSGSYSFAGVPGSVYQGSTWSAGVQYAQGPVGVAVVFSKINNSTANGGAFGTDSTTSNAGAQAGISAVTNGYQTAQSQQRFAVGAGYTFNSQFDITATYSNVQYTPGIGSAFHDEAVWNTGGIVLHWKPLPAWDFATGYSYTRASKANGIASSAQYQQAVLSEYYTLSKRTGIYALEAYQRANGQTLAPNATGGGTHIINATATIGDGFNSSPSSSRSMVGVGVGIVHRF